MTKAAVLILTGVCGVLGGMVYERRRWEAARERFRATHRRCEMTMSNALGSQDMIAWLPNDQYATLYKREPAKADR